MGRKHVWEGIVVADVELETVSIFPDEWDNDVHYMVELAGEIEEAGINRQHVRITVEVLETAGGATKEAVQREEM